MNWKMNAWTLLFALAAAGLIYLLASDKAQPKSEAELTTGCQPDSIPFNVAEGYMTRYAPWMLRMEMHKDSALHYGIKNPEVEFFELDSCELAEMVKFAQHGNVYAFLAVKDSLIDLLFLDENPNLPGSHSIRAFDFSTPCPPVCDTGGMTQ